MINKKFLSVSLLMLSLLALSACKWFSSIKEGYDCSACASCPTSSAKDTTDVLITINGKSALTAKEFEEFLSQASEGNDQFKLMLQLMPDFKEQLFNMKKRGLIFSEWAKKEGVRNSEEYRKKEKSIINSIRESLDAEEFIKRHKVDVTDADAQKFYDENKTQDPRILISAEGINASGVSFANQKDANDFAEKLKANKNIEQLAKDKKLKVEKFGNVTEEANVDAKVKEKVLAINSFPSVIVVKGENGKHWVVIAKGKEQAQFRPFEQVKETIKRLIAPKKLEEMIELEMPKYERDFKVVENKKYFEDAKKQLEQNMQADQTMDMQEPKVEQQPGKELGQPSTSKTA